jgi:hypothetical protein
MRGEEMEQEISIPGLQNNKSARTGRINGVEGFEGK